MARTTQKTTKPKAAKKAVVKKSTGTKTSVSGGKTKKTSIAGKSKKTPATENSGDDKKIQLQQQQQDSTSMTNLGSGDSAEKPAADPKVPDPPQSSGHLQRHQFKQRFDAKVSLTYLRSVCKNDVDPKTAIYMTAVMEYLTTEIAELSCNAARERTKQKRANITQQDLRAAVERDAELKALLTI